jgi:hypothetical protein
LQLTGVLTAYYWVLTGYYGGTRGLLWGTHGVLWGHASIPHRGARRRSTRHTVGWMRTASLRGRGSCCEGEEGVLWVLHRPLGYSSGTDHVVRALVSRCRPRAALTCGQRAHMRRVLRDCECGCSRSAHNGANDSGAVVQPRRYSLPATAGRVAWRWMFEHSLSHAKRRMRASPQGARLSVQCIMYNCIAHDWMRCVDCCPTGGGVLCSRLRVGRGWEQSVPGKLFRDRHCGGVRDGGRGSRQGLHRQ